MVLPSSHSPSVIKLSQAMRAALSDRQLGWNSRGVSSLLTVWRLPCAFAHLHFGVSRTNRNAMIIKPDIRLLMRTELCFICSRPQKAFRLAYYIDRNRMSNIDWRAFKWKELSGVEIFTTQNLIRISALNRAAQDLSSFFPMIQETGSALRYVNRAYVVLVL